METETRLSLNQRPMNQFLFEIGTEEIPAWMIADASTQMARGVEEALQEEQIEFEVPVRVYNSSRRLAVLIAGLPDRQPDRKEVVSGPPKSIAFDERGEPSRAAEGFARKLGVGVEDLTLIETERGEYLCLERSLPGRPVPEIVSEILPELIRSISWAKSMYWRASRFRFVRPIRWLVALWNDEVVEFEFEGVASGRRSQGHRFLGGSIVELSSAGEYVESLKAAAVNVDPRDRLRVIEKGLEGMTPSGLVFRQDPDLLQTVSYLNECPGVILGTFDEKYLELPSEVLITVMRFHQKYFAIENEKHQIQPFFLTVLNTPEDSDGRIREGHEKVLRARLDDAAFFWSSDRRISLEERVAGLGQVLFHERLGSYGDKTDRLRSLCRQLIETADQGVFESLDLAARLCKTDLTTDMVGELPELQGVMGGLYAREEGHPADVWKAIYEHYQPVSFEDEVPASRLGPLLSLADRLDTIAGCFTIGIRPKGSSDPLALRRLAQGTIKILRDLGPRDPQLAPLPGLIDLALSGFSDNSSGPEVNAEIMDFLERRVRFALERDGVAYDIVNAVLAVGIDHVHLVFERIAALSAIRGESDFSAIAAASKRVRNILTKEENLPAELDTALFDHESESALHAAYEAAAPRIEVLTRTGDFLGALGEMAGLRQVVDRFFDDVLVMAKDSTVRGNRLRLLDNLSQLFLQVADISKIVQPG